MLMSRLKFWSLGLLAVAGLLTAGHAQPGSLQAEEELVGMLAIQQEVLERAARAQDQSDIEDLRPRVQALVSDYESFLRRHPNYPEGYISYSMLLGNPLLDERERAMALLLKANDLNPNQAIVKNQLGKYLAEDGRPLDAANYFLAAIELEPNEALYHFQLGQVLGAARTDFVADGSWSPAAIDAALLQAFAEAARLAPDNLAYAYRRAEAFYDVGQPDWPAALAAWRDLEARVTAPRDQQVMQLQQANVLIFMRDFEAAKTLMAGVRDEVLEGQKDRLFERIARLERDPTAEDPPPVVVAGDPAGRAPAAGPPLPVFGATLVDLPREESLLGVSVAAGSDGELTAAFDSSDAVFAPSLQGLPEAAIALPSAPAPEPAVETLPADAEPVSEKDEGVEAES